LVLGQESLSLNDILTINSKNAFLKVVIENGYSEGNSSSNKIYYGKGLSKDKTKATDWAEFSIDTGEFYFEQNDLAFTRKNNNCYYDLIVAEIKKQCEYAKIATHSAKTGEVKFTTYDCPGSKYSGMLGFAQDHGNGIVQEFPK
jgi:hypothetical protein